MNKTFDYSHGASNTYLVQERHGLIMPCFLCEEFNPILLKGDEYFAYFMRGDYIHPECWDKMMGDGDE